MAKLNKTTARSGRRPAKRRSPARALSQRAASNRGRRTSYFSIGLSSSTILDFSFRQFKTSKAKRSKKNKQIVIPTPFLAVREIAITKQRGKSRRPSSQPTVWRHLKPAAALPVLLGLIGLVYFGFNLKQPAHLNIKPSGHVLAASTAAQPKTMSASTPVRLRIDKVSISAPIVGLGLKPDGSLDTPPGPDIVGWYSSSPTPGQLGPAVIDGHVDWINNIAIFWRLRELVPGDTFSVDRADGSTANFKVTAIQEFPQDNFPTKEVYGNINYAGIRLITCGGEFSTSTGHYSHNIVVFGSLI